MRRSSDDAHGDDTRALRLLFYSADGVEPGISMLSGTPQSLNSLAPVRFARSVTSGARELRDIERLIVERETACLEAWNEYFGD